MKLDVKNVAKNIYTRIYNSGKSTDYFYSPDFEKWVKEKAIITAYSDYSGEELKNIIKEIELL